MASQFFSFLLETRILIIGGVRNRARCGATHRRAYLVTICMDWAGFRVAGVGLGCLLIAQPDDVRPGAA